MRFRCERDALAEALGHASRAVSTRSALPILSAVSLEVSGSTLIVIGTDQEMTIRVERQVDTQEEGRAVVPARLLTDYVRTLRAGTVTVESGDDEQLQVSDGQATSRVRGYPVSDFPPVGGRCTEPGVGLGMAQFGEAVRQVIVAASRDEARPILTGALLTSTAEGIRLVATDVYRLAKRDLAGRSLGEAGVKVLVPARALAELDRLVGDEVRVVLSEREIVFLADGVQLGSRLIDGEFPNYEQLLPEGYPNRLEVKRADLTEALNRVKAFAVNNAPVKLRLLPDTVQLAASAQDIGNANDQIDAKYEGEEMTIAFNPTYLLAGIEAAGGETIVLETLDPLKPVVIKPGQGDDYLYLLMPVRI